MVKQEKEKENCKHDFKKKLECIKKETKEKVHQADEFVKEKVKEKPYKSLGFIAGISAAIGTAAGFLLGRKRKKKNERNKNE